MQSRVYAVLALLLVLSFPFRASAEVVKIAVYSSQDFHASMKQWQSTADYLAVKLPKHVFQVLPYSNYSDLQVDLRKNKLDFVLTAKDEIPQLVAEFAVIPVLNSSSANQDKAWTLAQNPGLPYHLIYSISHALLKLPANHSALKQPAIGSWQLSGDGQVAISSSQKLLRLYNNTVELVSALFKQYWTFLLACLLSCVLILLYRKWDHYHRAQQVKKHRQQDNDPRLSDTVF